MFTSSKANIGYVKTQALHTHTDTSCTHIDTHTYIHIFVSLEAMKTPVYNSKLHILGDVVRIKLHYKLLISVLSPSFSYT